MVSFVARRIGWSVVVLLLASVVTRTVTNITTDASSNTTTDQPIRRATIGTIRDLMLPGPAQHLPVRQYHSFRLKKGPRMPTLLRIGPASLAVLYTSTCRPGATGRMGMASARSWLA